MKGFGLFLLHRGVQGYNSVQPLSPGTWTLLPGSLLKRPQRLPPPMPLGFAALCTPGTLCLCAACHCPVTAFLLWQCPVASPARNVHSVSLGWVNARRAGDTQPFADSESSHARGMAPPSAAGLFLRLAH